VNGSLRHVAPRDCRYLSFDFQPGKSVDVILDDPYVLPFDDSSCDVIVSSSYFEHAEFLWLSFNEMLRILKPFGLLYLNVPSNGAFHRFPVDCWRFYPDSGATWQNWGRRNVYPVEMLESFTGVQKRDIWNDFVRVFARGAAHGEAYPNRMQHRVGRYTNGRLAGTDAIYDLSALPEDKRLVAGLIKLLAGRLLRRLTAGRAG